MNLKLTAPSNYLGARPSFITATVVILSLLLLVVSGVTAEDAVQAEKAAAADTTRVIVAYKPTAASAIKQAVAVARAGKQALGPQEVEMALADAKVVNFPSGTMSAMAIELPTASIAELSRNPNVAFVEKDLKRYLFGHGGLRTSSSSPSSTEDGKRDLQAASGGLTSPSTGNPYAIGQLVPYGIKMVQADLLASTNASNRKVCIIDSGYNLGHPDLPSDNSIVTGESIGIADWNFDSFSHGTHVAGTIAALNNNGTGVVGVHSNNSLKLHIINVIGDNEWVYSFDTVNAAFRCAYYAGANVISMSLGGEGESKWESMAYEEIYKYGILIVASAGNGGNSVKNSPASYSSVVSVAAIDASRIVAPFSTFNSDVELSGPGVRVLSTVGTGILSSLVVGSKTYASGTLFGSPLLSSSAPLADFGIGDKVDVAVSGKVCLIARGQLTSVDKVLYCQNSGGVAAIIYNNRAGGFNSYVGAGTTTIPSLTVSDTDGAALLTQLGQTANVTVTTGGYDYYFYDGTSMAAPHVSAVAALVWARNPKCTAAQLRTSLAKSALDLGAKGRDKYYGFGLVQAKAADDRIKQRGCGK